MNIQYFETLNEADGYLIKSVPFVGYIEENSNVIYNTASDKMIIINNNLPEITTAVDAVFNTLNDANGYVIESVPWAGYIRENQEFIQCTDSNKMIIVDNGVITMVDRSKFLKYNAASKLTQADNLESVYSHNWNSETSVGVVVYNNSVTRIGYMAFMNCADLASIEIPNSVTSIGNNAFFNCYNLTSVTIPNTVTNIGDQAFYNCSGLTSVTIPNSVTSIGESAFQNCNLLGSILCEAVNPPTIKSNTWYNVSKSIPLYVPSQSVSAYQQAQYWSEFTNIQAIQQS